jgi:hypothetical protein
MSTKLQESMTAQDVPAFVFTAYKDFYLRLDHTTGASTVALQQDLYDDADWHTVDTFTADGTWVVEVPDGCSSKFRTIITTLDTGPVEVTVFGKLNANDTIGGASPASVLLDENGDNLQDEAGLDLLDEAA